MIKFDKWYFPDGEQHLQGWMTNVNRLVDGRLTYQYGKYEAAKPFIKQFRCAIDIGAHVGLWSYFLCKDFEKVVSVEPCPSHIECFLKNMSGINNYELWDFALGNKNEWVDLESRTKGSSGDTQIIQKPGGPIRMNRLDDYHTESIDLIKIDCEGYEHNVLAGGMMTIKEHKPCIIVEQKPGMSKKYGFKSESAVEYLKSFGAQLRAVISGDYILSWD